MEIIPDYTLRLLKIDEKGYTNFVKIYVTKRTDRRAWLNRIDIL